MIFKLKVHVIFTKKLVNVLLKSYSFFFLLFLFNFFCLPSEIVYLCRRLVLFSNFVRRGCYRRRSYHRKLFLRIFVFFLATAISTKQSIFLRKEDSNLFKERVTVFVSITTEPIITKLGTNHAFYWIAADRSMK